MAILAGGYPALASRFYDGALAAGTTRAVASVVARVTAELPEGAAVLDVGCGGGQVLVALAGERPDLKLTGIDASPTLVAAAEKRADGRARFLEASALELPFADGEFDLVMSYFSIKHWPDRQQGLAECVRVLRKDGHVVVAELDPEATPEKWRRFLQLTDLPGWVTPVYARLTYSPFVGVGASASDLATRFALAALTDITAEPDPALALAWAVGRKP